MTNVLMKALREFPLGEAGSGSRRVQEGEEYTILSTQQEFHEKTGRGKPVEPKGDK